MSEADLESHAPVRWSDGWLLLAIARSGSPATLRDMMFWADEINRAIPVAVELEEGLAVLTARGLIADVGDVSFEMTETGEALVKRHSTWRRHSIDAIRGIVDELAEGHPADDGLSEYRPRGLTFPGFTLGAYEAALQENHERFERLNAKMDRWHWRCLGCLGVIALVPWLLVLEGVNLIRRIAVRGRSGRRQEER